jgi:hypothetical protein
MTRSRTLTTNTLIALGVAAYILVIAVVRPGIVHAQAASTPMPGALDVSPHQLIVRLTDADSSN